MQLEYTSLVASTLGLLQGLPFALNMPIVLGLIICLASWRLSLIHKIDALEAKKRTSEALIDHNINDLATGDNMLREYGYNFLVDNNVIPTVQDIIQALSLS